MRVFVAPGRPIQFHQQPQRHGRVIGYGFTLTGQHVVDLLDPAGNDSLGIQEKKHGLVDFIWLDNPGKEFLGAPVDIQRIAGEHWKAVSVDGTQNTLGVLFDGLDVEATVTINDRMRHAGNQQGA